MPPNDPVAYVVRHGRTVLNAQNAFRGNANPELDTVGVKQARELARLFESIDISHIFCSDRLRATKTAEIMAAAKNAPVHQSTSLRALDVGEFSGELRTPESEAALQVYLDSPDEQIPGGESLNEFKSRIVPCIQEAIDIYCECGTPSLIVAHSSVVHEVGFLAHGEHKSVLVEPGGAIAVYVTNGKLGAEPIFKPIKASGKSHAETIT